MRINYNGWANRDTWLTNLNIMNTSEIFTSVVDAFNRRCAWQEIEPENKGRRALILRFTIKDFEDLFIDDIDFEKVDYYEILEALEESLDEEALPETVGFFFGTDSSIHYAEQDREFIREARAAMKKGYTVVYSSWW